MSSRKIQINFICKKQNGGFDMDLFSIDLAYYQNKEVVFAKRIFKIKSPRWLLCVVFGEKDYNWYLGDKTK